MRAAAALALLALWVTPAACRVESEVDAVAEPAPDFELASLDGSSVALSELRGRPVIVDFWATWCGPCVHQIPVLNAFHQAHHDDGVVVLGVSVDAGGAEVVAPFAAEQEIVYPVLLGDEALAQRYGALGYPSLYVIAPDGSIDSAHVGVITEPELEEALRTALAR